MAALGGGGEPSHAAAAALVFSEWEAAAGEARQQGCCSGDELAGAAHLLAASSARFWRSAAVARTDRWTVQPACDEAAARMLQVEMQGSIDRASFKPSTVVPEESSIADRIAAAHQQHAERRQPRLGLAPPAAAAPSPIRAPAFTVGAAATAGQLPLGRHAPPPPLLPAAAAHHPPRAEQTGGGVGLHSARGGWSSMPPWGRSSACSTAVSLSSDGECDGGGGGGGAQRRIESA